MSQKINMIDYNFVPETLEWCRDETWVKNLLRPLSRNPEKTREEAAEFIERYKQNS